jgi:alpha-galactosidase
MTWRNLVAIKRMKQLRSKYAAVLAIALLSASTGVTALHAQSTGETDTLRIQVDRASGMYSIGISGARSFALTAGVAVEVDGRWLRGADYPHHSVNRSEGQAYWGPSHDWHVICSGLSGQPDLLYHLRAYENRPFGDIEVTVRNTMPREIHVESIRVLDVTHAPVLDLDGPADQDRVLSDSFSEDRPAMQMRDLGDAEHHMHRAVGSQLIYNRESHESLFLGALTSNRFLTILRLHLAASTAGTPLLAGYEVDSSGTTELEKENSLQNSAAADQIQLSLPVAPGAELSSERLLFSVSRDYHEQLEAYGSLIRQIHDARVSAPPLMGWWSWTAYYFGLNAGAAVTNAEWEAEHLKSFGYDVFHIDEGYQYARGEYATPNAILFPDGMAPIYYKAHGLGLVPGIWTAPFEVSERSWLYEHHPDWLIKNAAGKPIPAGSVVDNKDQLYMLDCTNPGAQDYLRKTYSILVHQWGIRYIKLDFMDDSAIEGYYYKPHTTAMEAQRIGLETIRQAVGDHVYLDKDGSVMLNPVGLVDYGRISQDTGHTFDASQQAASGIAARYYMDRNFFVSDPDAFTVSRQTITDQAWHESTQPATLDDAKVSIALAAVAGGMLEIGDNLPSLWNEPERVALLENQDLIDMVRLGKASVPLDLMSYSAQDQQPSIFLLKEDRRQSILTLFNWTKKQTEHTIDLSRLGLRPKGKYVVLQVFNKETIPLRSPEVLTIQQPPHSVRMLKIIDNSIVPAAPEVKVSHPSNGKAGATLDFNAAETVGDPVVSYRWQFGDGVSVTGKKVRHTYTEAGGYTVHLTATALSGLTAERDFQVQISGHMSTIFNPKDFLRYQ